MYYGEIKDCDIANGEGVRVSLFVSGCTHKCEGCFNPMTWDFKYGNPYTVQTQDRIITMLGRSYINGLSLLGGEPMEISNQRELLGLVKAAKTSYADKNIWCYTGYTLETDILRGRARCECTDELLSYIDVLVDGEFILAQKNISLAFRGSENQRLIDLPKTLKSGSVVLVDL